jgi:dATP pyrophosphohydrolase
MTPRENIPVRASAICAFVCRRAAGGHEVLMLYRNENKEPGGFWCQVAGGIEQGERAWEAALREIKEETQLVPSRLYATDRCEQFYNIRDECIVINPVFVAFVDEQDEVVLDEEHTQFAWLCVDDALGRLPYPGQRDLLEYVQGAFLDTPPNELLRVEPAG